MTANALVSWLLPVAVFILAWILCGLIARAIIKARGYTEAQAVVYGLPWGPIGLIYALLTLPAEEPAPGAETTPRQRPASPAPETDSSVYSYARLLSIAR